MHVNVTSSEGQVFLPDKATVNEVHVSGHPPARNFIGRINSLLVCYVIIGHVI